MTVSIIIPAYNAEATIADALESVRLQSYQDWELILVDDQSTDGTIRTIEDWCRMNPDRVVRIVRLDVNGGPARARNRGAELATGEWLAFLDADDVWMPSRLDPQLALLQACPGLALVCGQTRTLGEPVPETSAPGSAAWREIRLEDLVIANPVATSTVLLNKKVFEAVGRFDERFRGPEDYDLWLRVVACHRAVLLEVPLGWYRPRLDSLSVDDRRFLPEICRVIDKAYGPGGVLERGAGGREQGVWVLRRKAMAAQYLSACWMAANRGAVGRAAGWFLRSLVWWPFSFHPERALPWGRLKLLVFMARRMAGVSGS